MNLIRLDRLLPDFLLRSETYSLVVTDLEGYYIFVNDVFQKRFSFVCDNFIGKHSFIAIYHEDHVICLRAVEECFANPDKVVKVDLRKPDPNGVDFFWTSWEFSLLRDEEQKVVGVLCIGHDITETEKASRRAKAFAQKLEEITEEITEGFYRLDRDWRFVQVNKTAEKILGVPRSFLLGKSLWELFPDSPEYNYPEYFRKAMDAGITSTFEDYRPDLDLWFSAVVYPSAEGVTVFFSDITQSKRQEGQIKKQEYMLRAIYQSTHEASTFIDKNLIIRYNNKVARDVTEQVFGKAAKPGDWSLDYVLPELRSDFEDYYGRALEGESIITEQSDGANWWLFSIYPVTDSESGEIIGIAHNVQDITERKKRELELRESEARLQKTIEAIPNPLLIVDENVLIRYVNRDFEQVFGFHESEVLGKEIEILLPERYREKHTRLHQDYMREGGKSMRMGRFLTALTKSGDEIIVDASLNTFFVNGKRFVIIILQDVTELKKRQDTIAKQNEKLREIARQQSHELRRPLANILGLCDLLQNYGNESEANKAKFIELMLISAKELDAIVHKIVFEAQTEY